MDAGVAEMLEQIALLDTLAMPTPRPSPPTNTSVDDEFDVRPPLDAVDLRTLEYVGTYDHNLMCAICHSPFVHPVKLDCEHVFCQRCVIQAMRHQGRQSRKCPACRRPIVESLITPVPKILESILGELLVKCPLSNGCDEVMPRCHVRDHVLKYCVHFEVECPSEDCALPVQRKDAKGTRCLHCLVECEDCKEFVMEKDLESHRSNCEMGSTPCPDCKTQVAIRDLEAHIEHCPDAIFPCSASSYGCDYIARRAALEKHLKDCPLAKLIPFLKIQNERLEANEVALKHLRYKNAILENSISAIQESLDPSTNLIGAPSSSISDAGPFDSTAHHLLCLHESLREEVNRVSAAVTEVDAKASMMVLNESLRVKEELAHTNAAIGGMRMQLHWLVSSRLQNQQRVAMAKAHTPEELYRAHTSSATGTTGESSAAPVRRLSDSIRQETKL